MSKTEDALKEAFAGESQANRKYLAFAAKADQEGYPQAARLFRAAAEAETIHAHNHLRALKADPRHPRESRRRRWRARRHEFKSMYPAMIEAAKAEGNKEAERSFHFANEVEKVHARLYEKLLAGLGKRRRGLCLLGLSRLRLYGGERGPRGLPGLRDQGQDVPEGGVAGSISADR